MMSFLVDNCIKKISIPKDYNIDAFDYSKDLNLIASFEHNSELCIIWDPDDGRIVNEVKLYECHCDVAFLPKGRHIAVTVDEPHHGSGVCIYSIDSGEGITFLTEDRAGYGDMDVMARTLDQRLVVGGMLVDYILDTDNQKVLKRRKIGDEHLCYFMLSICCSKVKNNTICFTRLDDSHEEPEDGFYVLTFDTLSDGSMTSQVKEITYCYINGEKTELGSVTGLALDAEERIVVANLTEIIIMEAVCEGSIAHIIVNSGIPCDIIPCGRIMIDHKGRLLVSNGQQTIDVYEYQRCANLQELCRRTINNMLSANQKVVKSLPLPKTVQNYLLYQHQREES